MNKVDVDAKQKSVLKDGRLEIDKTNTDFVGGKIILIKLGGGLIAPKNWKYETLNEEVLFKLADEIRSAVVLGVRVVVVSGSGNFGHQAVKKFGINSEAGVSRVRKSARKIGKSVVKFLKNCGMRSRLFEAHKVWVNGDFEKGSGKAINRIEKYVNMGGAPVFYGDVAGEKKIGWKILSGENIIANLVNDFKKRGVIFERVIQVGLEIGVLDSEGRVIKFISPKNWRRYRNDVHGSSGVDVTGGMAHKVEESLKIAKNFGVETWIVGGTVSGKLLMAIRGEEVEGTIIRS